VAGILSLPFASGLAHAQTPRKSWRIGVLNAGPKDAMAAFDRVLEDGLRRASYAVGTDVSLDYRYPEWTGEDLPALAAELVSRNVDVIVAMSNPAITAAKQATTRLPIVMGLGADPVGAGFAKSLARPGGNVTGLTADPTLEIIAKELQFLKEATPTLSRVAVLWNATVPTYAHFFKALVNSHQRAGLVLTSFPVDKRDNLERAFGDIARSGADGVCVFADAFKVRGRQALDYPSGALQHSRTRHDRLDCTKKVRRVYRLHEEGVECPNVARTQEVPRVCRHRDRRNRRIVMGLRAQPAHEVRAGFAGHLQVADDERDQRTTALKVPPCVHGRGGGPHRRATELQQLAQEQSAIAVVVHNEHDLAVEDGEAEAIARVVTHSNHEGAIARPVATVPIPEFYADGKRFRTARGNKRQIESKA